VINNYSEDNTLEVIGGFPDLRIRCENFRNDGIIAASRNRGIRLSRGEFVAFLDSDDLWYPAKLSTCLRAMGEGVDAVYHGIRITEEGIPAGQLVPSPPEGDLLRTLLLQGRPLIATSSVIIRKCCLAEVGGFSEDREIVSAEDYDLWLRLPRQGTRFLPLGEILGEYRVHRGNAARTSCGNQPPRSRSSPGNSRGFRMGPSPCSSGGGGGWPSPTSRPRGGSRWQGT
jgi:glycosyltransferase involved in cell wall biosynthesis